MAARSRDRLKAVGASIWAALCRASLSSAVVAVVVVVGVVVVAAAGICTNAGAWAHQDSSWAKLHKY